MRWFTYQGLRFMNEVSAFMKVIHKVDLSLLLCKEVAWCHIGGWEQDPLGTESARTFSLCFPVCNCNKALLLKNYLLYGVKLKLTDEWTGTKRKKKNFILSCHQNPLIWWGFSHSIPTVPRTNIVPCHNYWSTNSPLVFLLPHVVKCNTQNNLWKVLWKVLFLQPPLQNSADVHFPGVKVKIFLVAFKTSQHLISTHIGDFFSTPL